MLEWLEPLHPRIVHFPFALFVTAFVLELISFAVKKEIFHKCALILYVGAALITPLVVKTGIWEHERLQLQHQVLESHEQFALLTMWVALMSLPVLYVLAKELSNWVRPVLFGLLLAVTLTVTLAAHYGGTLVFEYGVGTKLF